MDQPKVSQYIRARKRDNPSSNICKVQNDYESIVKSRIQQNQQLLLSLGLDKPFCDQLYQVHKKSHTKKYNVKRGNNTKASIPIRKSKRLAGETPTEHIEIPKLEELRNENEYSEKAQCEYQSTEKSYNPENIFTPYTLKSIKTTVYHLGTHVGVDDTSAFEFLSHDSCKFKHPYPVGYRAVKREFGRIWLMGIEKQGNGNPVFFIQTLEAHQEEQLFQGKQIPMSGSAYIGYAPTWPWTQACLKSKSPGRRISGPLYFGFSDPLNISKVMSLKGGYELLSKYEEQMNRDGCKMTQRSKSSILSQNAEE